MEDDGDLRVVTPRKKKKSPCRDALAAPEAPSSPPIISPIVIVESLLHPDSADPFEDASTRTPRTSSPQKTGEDKVEGLPAEEPRDHATSSGPLPKPSVPPRGLN
jgi:hypothetical protein